MEQLQHTTPVTPDILLDGVAYMIDYDQRLLRQWDDRRRELPFSSLIDEGSYLTMDRHSITGIMQPAAADAAPIIIPAELLSSREQLQSHCTRAFNTACHNYNWGIYVVDEQLGLRLAGKLPHLDIAGTDFTVDWRLRELRETDEPWKKLRFADMYETGNVFLTFYHTNSHELYVPPKDLAELPEHVVLAEIPNDLSLDPVAVAREHRLNLAIVLLEYPYQALSKASLRPLSESALPELIEQNKKIKQQAAQDKPAKKRGRRL